MIINNESVSCEYTENKVIKYKENDVLNIIDIENEVYIRENKEFIFKIEFKNEIFSYTLKENNIYLEDKLFCKFINKDNKIIFNYKLDDEKKEIIIHLL